MLPLEVLNVTARKWRVAPPAIAKAALWLDQFGVESVTPDLQAVACWVGTGLSAYDAAYVAVAESTGAELVTSDPQIVAAAPDHARPLAEVAGLLGSPS